MIAKMRNGGEACTAANRFYVEAPIAEEFTQRLTAAMSAMKVGPGSDADVAGRPADQRLRRDKVAELVDYAVEQGANLRSGGTVPDGEGYFYPPTVLSDVAANAAILQTEIFGPVAPVVTFTTEDEAIELANSTEYGLVSYVYTTDLARGLRVRANRGRHGWPQSGAGLRPGRAVRGVKESGLGREGGTEGLPPSPKASTSPWTVGLSTEGGPGQMAEIVGYRFEPHHHRRRASRRAMSCLASGGPRSRLLVVLATTSAVLAALSTRPRPRRLI